MARLRLGPPAQLPAGARARPSSRRASADPARRALASAARMIDEFRCARVDPGRVLGEAFGGRLAARAAGLLRDLAERPPHHDLSRLDAPLGREFARAAAATLCDAGAFRAVGAADLLRLVYGGDRGRCAAEIQELARQGLIRLVTPSRKPGEDLFRAFVTLTAEGRRQTDLGLKGSAGQVLYAGFRKLRHLRRDAALYRLFQPAAAGLKARGARVDRVVLDQEIRQGIAAEMRAIKALPDGERPRRLAELARRHELSVVDGRLRIPRARIEYTGREGQDGRLDLEWARSEARPLARAAQLLHAALRTSRSPARVLGQVVGRLAVRALRGPSSRRKELRLKADHRGPAPEGRRRGRDTGTQNPGQAEDPRRDAPPPARARRDRRPVPDPQIGIFERERPRLTEQQAQLLRDVGTFRAMRLDDVVRHLYGGDGRAARLDVQHLTYKLELLRAIKPEELRGRPQRRVSQDRTPFLTLTPKGRRLADRSLKQNPRQALYAGLRKPHELKHDASLYPMYLAAAAKLREQGREPVRVILDYEIKQSLNRGLARVAKDAPDRAERLEELARLHGLVVVDGKIPVPDVRIEYRDEGGGLGHCDLEYVTANYRAEGLVAKALAGFALYGSPDAAERGRRVLDEFPSLAAEILTV